MLKGLKALAVPGIFSLLLCGSPARPFEPAGTAEAAGCALYLKTFTGTGSALQFTGSYLPHITTVRVQVSPNNCVWKVDRARAGTAAWLTTRPARGTQQRPDGTFVGTGHLDLVAAENTGPARNTTIYFTTVPPGGSASYAATRVVQAGPRDFCQPRPDVAESTQSSIVGPGYLVLTKYGSGSGTPPASVRYRFRDTANCATKGGVVATTPNLRAPTTLLSLTSTPAEFYIQHAGVLLPQAGGAALARLGDTQSVWQGRSAVLVRYLLPHSALPPDLRIDPETLSRYTVAVSDGGGIVEVTGHAVRSTSNPSRPCAFNASYYRVVEEVRPNTGSQWLKLIEGTGCNPGSPDDGKLVIAVYPSAPGVSRLGALYTDWGSAIMIVQR